MNIFFYIVFLLILNIGNAQGKIPSLFNTGVNNLGVSLPTNTVDPHWTIDPPGGTGPSPVLTRTNGGWIARTAVSNWIGRTGPQSSGQYIFSTTFDLTGFTVNQVSIDYRITVDDILLSSLGIGVFLNGNSIPSSSYSVANAWTSWSPTFTLVSNNDSGVNRFVGGINTLSFDVRNHGGGVGFRFEQLSAVTPVPEPSTYLILFGVLSTILLLKSFKDKKKKA
jgi:hypothetical protein